MTSLLLRLSGASDCVSLRPWLFLMMTSPVWCSSAWPAGWGAAPRKSQSRALSDLARPRTGAARRWSGWRPGSASPPCRGLGRRRGSSRCPGHSERPESSRGQERGRGGAPGGCGDCWRTARGGAWSPWTSGTSSWPPPPSPTAASCPSSPWSGSRSSWTSWCQPQPWRHPSHLELRVLTTRIMMVIITPTSIMTTQWFPWPETERWLFFSGYCLLRWMLFLIDFDIKLLWILFSWYFSSQLLDLTDVLCLKSCLISLLISSKSSASAMSQSLSRLSLQLWSPECGRWPQTGLAPTRELFEPKEWIPESESVRLLLRLAKSLWTNILSLSLLAKITFSQGTHKSQGKLSYSGQQHW